MERGEKPSMEFPLLASYNLGVGEGSDQGFRRQEVLVEVKKQLWLAGPLIVSCLLQTILQVISVMFLGHLGELALSGGSMATSFCSVTGFSFLMGLASALDTFCGQSYGAKQFRMLGVHMQRAMLIIVLTSIPIACVWACTRQILMFFGQDPEISREAGTYARWLLPTLLAYGLIQCQNRFLQTQNIVFPSMISSGFTALMHIFFCWTFVYKFGLGSKGAALAMSVSYWMNVIVLALYIKFSPVCAQTWSGFSSKALCDVFDFVKLAIPSAIMICLEWWSFEMLVLLSGLLPNPKLETSVLSISLNTAAMVFMIPFGLGAAISVRVSNELGAGHPQAASLAVRVVVMLAVIEGLVIGLIMVLVRHVWGRAYSNEEEVVNYVAIMLPILAASNFLDGIQSVLSGIARGCGWQKLGAFANLGAYYIVGVPSAALLAFVLKIGGKGLWIGIICGVLVQVALLGTITLCTNWEKEAKKARDRVESLPNPISADTLITQAS